MPFSLARALAILAAALIKSALSELVPAMTNGFFAADSCWATRSITSLYSAATSAAAGAELTILLAIA